MGRGVDVLTFVNLTTQPGEFVSMVGASRSGKTTLLRMLDALIVPGEGVVRIGDREVTGRPDAARVMVFQRRDAAANVGFGLEILGVKEV